MNLTGLLAELKPLVADPDAKFSRIVELLERHQRLAEYQVARFYVASALAPRVDAMLRSLDPRERARALSVVRLTYGRAMAARAVRNLAKDPDSTVRAAARHAVRALALDDVAIPDMRVTPRKDTSRIGGWNPSGWGYGLAFAARYSYGIQIKRPARKSILDKKNLPALAGAADIARLVGLDDAEEITRLVRPGTGEGSPYVEFEIAKATGGTRRIAAPRAPLRAVQRAILEKILNPLGVHPACHGFVAGRSTVTNAAPHRRAAVVVKVDLKDFFPTVHYRRVRGFFTSIGYGDEAAGLLAALTTYRPRLADGTVVWPGVLPQGAPTSPALANLVARRLDARLLGLAQRVSATYTRYADDLTFSFAAPPTVEVGRFLWWVDGICQQEGFVENAAKRRVLRPAQQQRVTGIVVNEQLSIPRNERRKFRAILSNCRRHGVDSQARGHEDFRAYLLGYAAYVKMVQPALGEKLVAEVASLLGSGA